MLKKFVNLNLCLRVMTNVEPEGQFFYPPLTQMIDSVHCLHLKFVFSLNKSIVVPENTET